jgi:hypothetical protein
MERTNDRTGIFHTINGERREIVIEMPDPVQSAIFDSWTPAQRLRAGREHSKFLRRMFRAQLQSLHPEWSEEELMREIARRTLGESV